MREPADRVLTQSLLGAAGFLERVIAAASKQGEFAALLIRVCASLDTLVGGNAAQKMAWMRSYNRSLNGRPQDLVQSIQGLASVVAYLDAMRTAN